ncbi:MAG: PKD domain-containing protein, partial [Methanomicrobiales archaeon]|nr:PKD domain-containing protein [Methanomicrobiales archaeon]
MYESNKKTKGVLFFGKKRNYTTMQDSSAHESRMRTHITESLLFHVIFIIALTVALSTCVVSAANIVTYDATDVTATLATLNGEITYIRGGPCEDGSNESGPCDYGGVKPLFIAVPQGGLAPLEIQFNDMSTGDPIAWQWDFGDGTKSTEQNPKHVYQKPGKYSVTLWISNGFNSGVLVLREYIIVFDVPEAVNVVTSPATDVTDVKATLNGALVDLGLGSSADLFFNLGLGSSADVPFNLGLEPRADVFFKFGTESNLNKYTHVEAGTLSRVGVFNSPISGLIAGTTYYFQACAKTNTGKEVCGGVLPFTTEVASADVFFKFGTDPHLGTHTLVHVGRLSHDSPFKAGVSGLTAGTRYYFNACATTSAGEICDGILSFIYEPLSVVTLPPTDQTSTGATLNGGVTNMGGESSVDMFFKYGTDPSLGTHTRVEGGTLTEEGTGSAGIFGLTPGNTYYVQACATTSTGEEVCGGIISFVLPVPTPTPTATVTPTPTLGIVALPPTNQTGTDATLNGVVTDMGGETSV